MSRRAALDRLSDISKQRCIRRPLLVLVPKESAEDPRHVPDTLIEWPLSR